MKTLKVLLMLLLLGGWALAQLPNSAPYNRNVSLRVPLAGLSLETALVTLAQSIGHTAFIYGAPNITIKQGFTNKPFNQIWNLLIDHYTSGTLDYRLLPNSILVVAPKKQVEELKPTPNKNLVIFDVTHRDDLAEAIARLLPDIAVVKIGKQFAARVSKEEEATVRSLISRLDKPQITPAPTVTPPVAATPPPPPPPPDPAVLKSYTFEGKMEEATKALALYLPTAKVTQSGSRTLLVEVPTSEHPKVERILSLLELPPPPPPPIEPAPTEPSGTPPLPIETPAPLQLRTYTSHDPEEAAKVLTTFLNGIKVLTLKNKALMVEATEVQHTQIELKLAELERLKPEQRTPEPKVTAVRNFPTREAETVAKTLAGLLQEAKVQAVPGGIIVEATPEGLDKAAVLIAEIIKNFPPEKAAEVKENPVTKSYPLNYAKATAVATAIKGSFSGITVNADERSNNVLVAAIAREHPAIEAAIKRLDNPLNQVRLRVRVQSLDSSQAARLGISWSASIGNFAIGLAPSGLSLGYRQGANAFLSLLANLDALEERGLSRKIVNSELLTQDGREGLINSGGQLLYPQTNAQGQITGYATYQYGLVLKLTPQVAQNGDIQLKVDFSQGDKPITGPQNTIQIPSQNLISNVTFKDGQTIVLGGLISREATQGQDGLPWLSDIPLIGELFKSRDRQNTQSTLLIIISGDIISSTAQLEENLQGIPPVTFPQIENVNPNEGRNLPNPVTPTPPSPFNPNWR